MDGGIQLGEGVEKSGDAVGVDSGGGLIEDLPVEREGDRIAFDLPPDALYLLLTEGEP
ncbi:MAG: hypothetical protein ACLFS1_10590 [Opitutales bacterium]